VLEFFTPATHLPSIPSHRSDTAVAMDSNDSSLRGSVINANTQASALVPLTDPSTSMAAQAMVSLGAAPNNAYLPAGGSAPVISQAEAVSVVVRPKADAAPVIALAEAVSEVPIISQVKALSVVVRPT
jgi:hypothetical protein